MLRSFIEGRPVIKRWCAILLRANAFFERALAQFRTKESVELFNAVIFR